LFFRRLKIFVDTLVMVTFYPLEWNLANGQRTAFNSIERGLVES